MEGFLDGVPVLAKVSWAVTEVPLLNGKPTSYGLLGETATAGVPGGVTRWFVPWSAISYLKQDIPVPPQAVPPVTVAPVVRPPAPGDAPKVAGNG